MRAKKIHSEIRKVAKNEGSDDVQAVVTVKSKAAGGLYAWCSSTDKCYDIYKEVEPKRKKAQLMT